MTLTTQLQGSVAIITGGSRGLGRYCAEQLASQGCKVVMVGINPQSVADAQLQLQSKNLDVIGKVADVADPVAMDRLVVELGELANPQILINSAGVMSAKMTKTLRTSNDEWHRVLGINLDGVFNSVSRFAPSMIEQRYGRIINLSACLGSFTGPGLLGGLAPYRISKTGVNALTKNLAAELQFGARNVLVDAVCPGHIQTDMGGETAPRTVAQGADTVLWLATRAQTDQTGLLWEDRQVVPY